MLNLMHANSRYVSIIIRLLPVLSFAVPFAILYCLYPLSFQKTYQGRTFYLFFLWLVFLEIILNWGKVRKFQISKLKSIRIISLIILLLLPTIYVVVANYYGLNALIVETAKQNNIPLAEYMPLSTEYMVFAALFALIILLAHGGKGFMDFSIPTFFLASIGVIYTIDDLYPYAWFTPFQILVPSTAMLAANVLNLMGYPTKISLITHPEYGTLPYLSERYPKNPLNPVGFGIAWPCAGVESLLIYAVTTALFLKKLSIPWKHGLIYFIIGAVITYVINIFRIVTMFIIAMNGGDIWVFHDYYGWLYSVTWIISYPLIIIGSRILWGKIRNWKAIHDVWESSEINPK